jgi:hypothetical protein
MAGVQNCTGIVQRCCRSRAKLARRVDQPEQRASIQQ